MMLPHMALAHHRVCRSLILVLFGTFCGFAFPAPVCAGVLVTNGSQYVEISGLYHYNFYHSMNTPYHDLLQPNSPDTLTSSVSEKSFDIYARLTGLAAVTHTVTPSSADASSLMLNTHAMGTCVNLAADFAQSYNFGRDYLLFTLDAPSAFTLTVNLSADSSRQGPGNSQASSEAYLQLVGASDFVKYVYVESDDGAAPGSASQTLKGNLDAGSYKLWNYSFASGYGSAGSSSSPDATGAVTLSFPSNGGPPVTEPPSFILLSLGAAGAAAGVCLTRRRPRTQVG